MNTLFCDKTNQLKQNNKDNVFFFKQFVINNCTGLMNINYATVYQINTSVYLQKIIWKYVKKKPKQEYTTKQIRKINTIITYNEMHQKINTNDIYVD